MENDSKAWRNLVRNGIRDAWCVPSFHALRITHHVILPLLLILLLSACVRPMQEGEAFPTYIPSTTLEDPRGTATSSNTTNGQTEAGVDTQIPTATAIVNRAPATPFPVYEGGLPTPDPVRAVNTVAENNNTSTTLHTIAAGENLNYVAQLYNSTLDEILILNNISNPELIFVGQQLIVPFRDALAGSAFKIVPDSEIINGVSVKDFDVREAMVGYGSSLLIYVEDVEGETLAGPEIVQLVADRFMVNPRLLLAVMEHRAGLLTGASITNFNHPLGYDTQGLTGLYWQLGRVANLVSGGYYGWQEGIISTIQLDDDAQVKIEGGLNAGTIGIQNLFANHEGATYSSWLADISENGFYATYNRLFGNPFAYTHEPIWENPIVQPTLRLPWSDGATWYFTGGPHGGYGWGTPWAALDFVPAGEQLGCYESDDWVVAMADGKVIRSSFGAVVIDLDGDGNAGTGWVIHTLHLATRDRVPAGTFVEAGDRIGHPSCEGGFSNGTHIHITRTYNGQWVHATKETPFVMNGWTAQGANFEYNGWLVRNDETKEACECREAFNGLLAE